MKDTRMAEYIKKRDIIINHNYLPDNRVERVLVVTAPPVTFGFK